MVFAYDQGMGTLSHDRRNPHRYRHLHALSISVLFFMPMLTACGGGNGSAAPAVPPPSVSSITVTCTPSTIVAGGTSQCAATVQGAGNYSNAVTWSATSGTISTNGLFTAPAAAATVTITATSTQDTSISGKASITVQPPAPTITSVQVTCDPTVVSAGSTSQCNAAVQGTGDYNPAVTWSASAGTITSAGLFTAPAVAASATITATSVQDATQSGQVVITVQSAAVRSSHIVMVIDENKGFKDVVRNTIAWPNLNNLIANGALPTHYFANAHPSIGNYFMLTTGQLLTNTDGSTAVWNVDSIARRMLAANVPFRVYAEGIPRGYVGDNTGTYLVRHNPFAKLSDIANNPQVANQCIWPFSQFAIDLANGTLPAFSFIIPDTNDDAHNGTAQQADAWLQTNVVLPLSNNSAFAPGGNGLLIVGFDEAANSDLRFGGGHVAFVFWGPIVKAGYTQASTTIYQHQSILRTIMDLLGLQDPPAAAAHAPIMSEFFIR